MRTVVYILCIIMFFSGLSSAELKQPTYHKGDYWEYKIISGTDLMPYEGTLRYEIKNETTITANGESYDVWEIFSSSTRRPTDANYYYNMTVISYHRKSDDAVVKQIWKYDYFSPYGVGTYQVERTYKNIQPDLEFPVNVGNAWERHSQFEYRIIDTGENDTAESYRYYECIGTSKEKTDVGKFLCYVIKTWSNSSSDYSLAYYSNKVGNIVKSVTYSNNTVVESMTLTAYKYGINNGGLPSFEIYAIIIAVIITFIASRKMKVS